MAPPTLKSALNHYLHPTNPVEELRYRPLIRPSLSEADRAHLERWLDQARDPVWEQLAADIRRHGELPSIVDAPYSLFIGAALRARQFAESQKDSPSVQRKRKQQRDQHERADLLELADKIDDVHRHCLASRKARQPVRVPSPNGPLPEELEEKNSLEWLGRKAHRLRQLAEAVSADEPNWDWGPIPVRASRQSGGKRKRAQSRELGLFMQRMVNCMHELCGKPRHHVVATITNIAFPNANVTSEDVRSACRLATRSR